VGVASGRTRTSHLLWTSTAYFGEGLPYSFLHQLVTEYLTSIGAPRSEIGYTSWFHGAVALKPAVGPWIDAAGARRNTMIVLQVLLGLGMLASAALVVGPETPRTTAFAAAFWTLLAALALIHAVHDIACDGFFIVALPRTAQALYAGTRMAAYRAAMYVGSAVLTLVAAWSEWSAAFAAAGALMALVALVNAAVVPRIDEPRDTSAEPAAFQPSYRAFFAQPHIWRVLAFVVSYRLGDVLTFAMSPPLLRELGMDTEARGWLRMISLTASIVGSILAGALLARGGLRRWFAPFTYLMALPFYLLLAWLRPGFWAIAGVVALEQFFGALAGAALPFYLVQRSRRAFAAAHYGLFSAFIAAASSVVGGLSGHLSEAVGHVAYFGLCFVASVPALVLVHVVPLRELEDPDERGPGAPHTEASSP
jgi:PAT family beta-lactamase induction signal transducer AmpG